MKLLDNPYHILGVDADANDEALKIAYRNLARKYHPDVSDDPDSNARFHQVSQAYKTLKDPVARAKVDEVQAELVIFNSRRPNPKAPDTRGPDVTELLRAEYQAFGSGGVHNLTLDLLIPCQVCSATGRGPNGQIVTCPECDGSGHEVHVQHTFNGDQWTWRPCTACRTSGFVIDNECMSCTGEGRVVRPVDLSVQIPAGMQDGSFVCVRGYGHAGFRGAPSGDLYLELVASDIRG